jgi:hypothetical protein
MPKTKNLLSGISSNIHENLCITTENGKCFKVGGSMKHISENGLSASSIEVEAAFGLAMNMNLCLYDISMARFSRSIRERSHCYRLHCAAGGFNEAIAKHLESIHEASLVSGALDVPSEPDQPAAQLRLSDPLPLCRAAMQEQGFGAARSPPGHMVSCHLR